MKMLVTIAVLCLLLISGCTTTISRTTPTDTVESTVTGELNEDVSNLDALDEELNVEEVDVNIDELESVDF